VETQSEGIIKAEKRRREGVIKTKRLYISAQRQEKELVDESTPYREIKKKTKKSEKKMERQNNEVPPKRTWGRGDRMGGPEVVLLEPGWRITIRGLPLKTFKGKKKNSEKHSMYSFPFPGTQRKCPAKVTKKTEHIPKLK